MTTEQPLKKQDVRISIELIHACLISSVNEKNLDEHLYSVYAQGPHIILKGYNSEGSFQIEH